MSGRVQFPDFQPETAVVTREQDWREILLPGSPSIDSAADLEDAYELQLRAEYSYRSCGRNVMLFLPDDLFSSKLLEGMLCCGRPRFAFGGVS